MKKFLLSTLLAGVLLASFSSEVYAFGTITHAQVGVDVWEQTDGIKNILENTLGVNLGDPWGSKDEVIRYYRFRNAFIYGCNAPDVDKICDAVQAPNVVQEMEGVFTQLNKRGIGGYDIDIRFNEITPWSTQKIAFALQMLSNVWGISPYDEKLEKICFALGYLTHLLQDKYAHNVYIPWVCDYSRVGDLGLKDPIWGHRILGQLETLVEIFIDTKIDINIPQGAFFKPIYNESGIVYAIYWNELEGTSIAQDPYVVHFNLPQFLDAQINNFPGGVSPGVLGLENTFRILTTQLDFMAIEKGEICRSLSTFFKNRMGTNKFLLLEESDHTYDYGRGSFTFHTEDITASIRSGSILITYSPDSDPISVALSELDIKGAFRSFMEGYRNNESSRKFLSLNRYIGRTIWEKGGYPIKFWITLTRINVDFFACFQSENEIKATMKFELAGWVKTWLGGLIPVREEFPFSIPITNIHITDIPVSSLQTLDELKDGIWELVTMKCILPNYNLDNWFSSSVEYQFAKRADLLNLNPNSSWYTNFPKSDLESFIHQCLSYIVDKEPDGVTNEWFDDGYWPHDAKSARTAAVNKSLLRDGYNGDYIAPDLFYPRQWLQVYDVKYSQDGVVLETPIISNADMPVTVQTELFSPRWRFDAPPSFTLGIRIKTDNPLLTYESDEIIAEYSKSFNLSNFTLESIFNNGGERIVFPETPLEIPIDPNDYGYHVELTYDGKIFFTTDLEPFLYNGIEHASVEGVPGKREKMDILFSTYVPYNPVDAQGNFTYPNATAVKSLRFSEDIEYSRTTPVNSDAWTYVVESAGWHDGTYVKFKESPTEAFNDRACGIHAVVIRSNGSVTHMHRDGKEAYDTHNDGSAAQDLIDDLADDISLPKGTEILLGISEGGVEAISYKDKEALATLLNSDEIWNVRTTDNWSYIGKKRVDGNYECWAERRVRCREGVAAVGYGPLPPLDLTADAIAYDKIKLCWTPPPEQYLVIGYNYNIQYIEGSTFEGVNPGEITTISVDNAGLIDKYTVEGLTGGIQYTFRVMAKDKSGNTSPPSNEAWEYAIPMWSDNPNALAFNNNRKIAVAPDGTICVVWIKGDSLWYAESKDNGNTWIEDLLLAPSPKEPSGIYGPVYTPTIAVDSEGRKFVAWVIREHYYDTELIQYSYTPLPNTDTWTEPTVLWEQEMSQSDLGKLFQEEPSVFIAPNNEVHIVWKAYYPSSEKDILKPYRICHCHFPITNPPYPVDASFPRDVDADILFRPSVCTDVDGIPHIIWEEGNIIPEIWHAKYGDMVWDKSCISQSDYYSCYPAIAPVLPPQDGEYVYASWIDFTNSTICFSSYKGNSWSSFETVAYQIDAIQVEPTNYPSVTNYGKYTVVSWRDDNGEIYYSKRISPDNWSEHINISESPTVNSIFSHIVLVESYLYIIWLEGNNIPHEIKFHKEPLLKSTVAFPNGGERLEIGNTYKITWDTEGRISEQYLEYTADNGVTWYPINSGYVDISLRFYDWTIPEDLSKQCRVRVTVKDIIGDTEFDESDANFSICWLTSDLAGATFPNSQKKLAIDENSNIHLLFSDANIVRYAKSEDGGITWPTEYKQIIGEGKFGALTLDIEQKANVCWLKGSGFYYTLWYSRDFGIPEQVPSPISGDAEFFPPVIVVDGNSLVHLALETWGYDDTKKAYIWALRYGTFPVGNPADISWEPPLDSYEVSGPPPPSPSIDVDQDNKPFIVYTKNDSVYYITKNGTSWNKIQVSDGKNPFLDVHNGVPYVTWEMGNDVWHWTPGSEPENVTNVSWKPSISPQMINGNIIVWSESSEQNGGYPWYEVWYKTWDGTQWSDAHPLSSIWHHEDSKYPQIAFERDGPDGKLWCAWTEGNNSPYEVKFETATFPLVTGKVVTSSTVPYATGLSNAKRMVATGDRLNLVYTSGAHLPQDGGIGRIVPILFPEGNSVYHTYSDDGGITWADSIKIASGGQYPCLIEDPDVDNGLVCTWSEAKWQEFYQPYPGHVYLGSVIKLYLAKYNPSTGWGQPTCISVEFPGLDSLKIIGGPDIAVSTNSDSAWLVWEQLKTQGAPEYIVEPEPPWDTIAIRLEFPSVSLLRGTFLRSNPVETFVVDTIDSHQRGWIRIPVPDTTLHHPIISLCPSVSWQPSLGVRIAWDPWDEEVYIYEWQDTTWIKECISSSDPDRPAQDPHLVGRNNELCCVWVDKSDGNFDTYHYRLLSGPKGESEEKTQFSSMSGYNSLDPINVDGYHTIWVEQSTDGSYKLQYSRYENFEWQPAVTLLEALVSIRYPQAVLMGNVLHYTWTQGAGEPYFICGDTIMIEETPELAVNLGSQESSPYTEQRDGYIEDSDPLKQRDYSETELIYEISGLHGSPGGSHLKLKAYFYHEGEDWKLGLQVDDGQTINKWVAPGSLIVVQKIINESAFKDSTIRITIKSLPPTKNALVVCSGFELYHYQSGGDGGAQSAAGDGTSPHVFKLNQNYPNPFVCKTTIKYAIPRKAKVSLKVYNVAGRLVHTLVNGKKEPGYYTINWDAKEFPSGIYFTKLDAGNYTSTKKLILMR